MLEFMFLHLCWVIHFEKKDWTFNAGSSDEKKEDFNSQVWFRMIYNNYVSIIVIYCALNWYGLFGSKS